MAQDFQGYAGAAATGAGIGTAIAPGIGTAIGAGVGLLGNALFGDKEDAPAFQDLSDPKISAIAQSLMRKKLGAKYASRQKTLNTRNANMSMEKVDNSGTLNPTERAGAYNAINRSAEESNVSANLSGATEDQNAETKAASLLEANNNLSMQRNQFAREGWQINQRPSAFESLASTALANTLGQVVQSGLNPKAPAAADEKAPPANPPATNNPIPYTSSIKMPQFNQPLQTAPQSDFGYTGGNLPSVNIWDTGIPQPKRPTGGSTFDSLSRGF